MSPLVEKDAMTERGPEPPKNPAPSHAKLAAGERATVGRDNLLTRSEAAAVLGRHASSVRRFERKSRLVAELGADGVHRFREGEVRELAVELRAQTAQDAPERYDAAMAAEAFDHFDAGVHPVDVVKKTRWDPRAVEAMHRQWVTMRGGYVVTAAVAKEIASLPWLMGARPICTGEQLLKNLRQSVPHGPCTRCEEEGRAGSLAEVCGECARSMSASEAERRAAQTRLLRAQAQARRHEEMGESDLSMKLERARRATRAGA
jgi:hypothetical protein